MAVVRISFAESALGDLSGIQDWCAEEGVPEDGTGLPDVWTSVGVFAVATGTGTLDTPEGEAIGKAPAGMAERLGLVELRPSGRARQTGAEVGGQTPRNRPAACGFLVPVGAMADC